MSSPPPPTPTPPFPEGGPFAPGDFPPAFPPDPGPAGAALLPPALRWIVGLLLVAAGLQVRAPHLTDTALDFHPVRQYRSALIATGFATAGDPGTVGEVGSAYLARNRPLEPPLSELVTSWVWRTTGERSLLVPRVLATLYWLLGVLALHRLARRLVGPDAAFVASGFLLLAPYLAAASTSFQPDPAMIALTCAGLLGLERLAERPSRKRFLLAALACGAAVLVKPVALFPLALGGLARFSLGPSPAPRPWRDARAWLFAFVALAPTALWYLWGTFVAGFLEAQAQNSFQPRLLLDPVFWGRLGRMLSVSVGIWPLALGALGLLVARPAPRRWLLGLAAGYVVYVALFTHHTSTHDYYHLPLFPAVALALAALAQRVFGAIALLQGERRYAGALVASGLALIAIGLGLQLSERARKARDVGAEMTQAAEVGAELGGRTSVVCVGNELSKPLQFHGGFAAWNWPWSRQIEAWRRNGREDAGPREQLLELTGGEWPDWFCVAQTRELQRQPQLRRWLDEGFPVVQRSSSWILYDLRR